MANFISNKTAQEVKQFIQEGKDRGEIPTGSKPRATANNTFFELVTDLGDDLWTGKEKGYNTTTNAWDDITNGRTPSASVPLLVEGGGGAGDIVRAFPSRDTDGDPLWIAIRGGGSSLTWITTDNTGLSFANGAQYDYPGGTGTALTVDDNFYISTPWNTRITAPNNYFGYFLKDGNNWYHGIEKFYVKPGANYPSGAGAGITTFTCYLNNDDASLNLGTNTAFPTGIKVILDGFDNVNAGSNSLSYFNGKVFPASFDAAANIIYLDHPHF